MYKAGAGLGCGLWILLGVAVVLGVSSTQVWPVLLGLICFYPLGAFAFGIAAGDFRRNWRIVPNEKRKAFIN